MSILILISEDSSSFSIYFLKIGKNRYKSFNTGLGLELDNRTSVYVATVLILLVYLSDSTLTRCLTRLSNT